jgi:ribonucleoside-diphosphate reductase alpha chain
MYGLTFNFFHQPITFPKVIDPGLTVGTKKKQTMEYSEQALKLLKDYYMLPGEATPVEAYRRAALAYSYGDTALADRITGYATKGWFMYASPVLSNAPIEGEKVKGLPISCFLTYVPDNLDGLIDHTTEVRWLSVKGGGVGGHWSDIRSTSDIAPSPIPFLKTVDADMTAYRQGKTRKGSYAAYLDVSHPDIIEFLSIRVPTGGDPNRKCFNLHNAINITDAFMDAVFNDETWNLIDPNDKTIRDSIKARELWQRILETRFRTGEPYLNFIDTANKHLNQAQQDLGLKINGSNLCNEIHLVTSKDRTAVCCLSSVNLEFYDEWKDTSMVKDLIRFLDNVLQFFIDHAPSSLHRAVYSAKQERSLGLGAMGFHSYLQKNLLPWESAMAVSANRRIFADIKAKAVEASQELAKERGEPGDLKGTGMRNAHLLAIAPNANSSIIVGCSPSIEPWKSNAYTHRTRAGAHLVKNKYLEMALDDLGMNTPEVWQSITLNDGSIEHLNVSQDLKDVFKTAFELDQGWVVDHAAHRQPWICQGQSVNLFFPSGSDKGYVNSVHLRAYKGGLKGLYYLRTNAGVSADKISQKITRNALKDSNECLACHG